MMKIKPAYALDLINLSNEGTQYTKSVKLKESTYNMLRDLKASDPKLKSLDDVVVNCIAITAIHSAGK